MKRFEEGALRGIGEAPPIPRDITHKETYRTTLEHIREHTDRETYKDLRRWLMLERAKQNGAKLMNAFEAAIREDPAMSGAELQQKLEEAFAGTEHYPLSRDQRKMIELGGACWDNTVQMVRGNLRTLMYELGIIASLEEGEALSVYDIESACNTDVWLKWAFLRRLGGDTFNHCDAADISSIDIDLTSHAPAVVCWVRDPYLWGYIHTGGKSRYTRAKAAFLKNYSGERDISTMGLYVATQVLERPQGREMCIQRTQEEITEVLNHEWHHFVRYHVYQPVLQELFGEKVVLGEDIDTELAGQEQRLGGVFRRNIFRKRHDVDARHKQLDIYLNKKHEENLVEGGNQAETLTQKLFDARYFWLTAQDELVAYLRAQKELVRRGSLTMLGSDIRDGVNKKEGLVEPQAAEDFDVLHDVVVLYRNAGVSADTLADIIATSEHAAAATERIRRTLALSPAQIQHALAADTSFAFRNGVYVLDEIIMPGQHDSVLLKHLTPQKIATLYDTLLYEDDFPRAHELFPDIACGEEEKTYRVLQTLRASLERHAHDRALEGEHWGELYATIRMLQTTLIKRTLLIQALQEVPEAVRACIVERVHERMMRAGTIRPLCDTAQMDSARTELQEYHRIAAHFEGGKQTIFSGADEEWFKEWLTLPEGIKQSI